MSSTPMPSSSPPMHFTRALMRALGAAPTPEVRARAWDYGIDLAMDRVLSNGRAPRDMALRADVIWRRHKLFELMDLVGGCDALVLKGEALSCLVYGDPFMRRSGDIDLLVRWDDLDAWVIGLRALGYVAQHEARAKPWLYDQWAFVHPETALVIELHWGIAPPVMPSPSNSDLFDRSQCVLLGTRECFTLGNSDTLLHLGYHFHHHSGFIKGLVDIAAWCDRYADEQEIVEETLTCVERLGVGPMMHWPLRVLEIVAGRSLCEVVPGTVWSYAMAKMSVHAIDGALGVDAPINPAGALSFKTRGISQAHSVLWQSLGYGACSKPMDAFRVLTFGVWRSPGVLAAERGARQAGLQDVVGVLCRPAYLIWKQVRVRGIFS